jgi:fibronectin type 3 domain-containing protein
MFLFIAVFITGCSTGITTPDGLNATREIYDPVDDMYGDRITLTWDINSGDSSLEYRIYRAYATDINSDISSYLLIGSTSQTSYTDDLIESNVNPGIIYYKISSVSKEGKESPLSKAVSIEYIPYG